MRKLRLIPLGAGDAEEAAALHARCFDDPWSAKTLAAGLSAHGAIGLAMRKVGGGLIAFALAQHAFDEADIQTLAVDPDYRRQGIAGDLLARLLARLDEAGVRRAFLEVAEDNPAGLALYSRAGFSEIGRRRGYYSAGRSKPIDAILMIRTSA